MLKGSTANEASRNITEAMYYNQMKSKPVHQWKDVDMSEEYAQHRFHRARDIMETEVYIAKEDDIVELAINMMDWKNIRSIPVENSKNELVGLITAREILKYHTVTNHSQPETVGEIMEKEFITVPPEATTAEVVALLGKTRASCALVVDGKYLVGLVSESDIVQVARMTKIFKK